MNEVWLQKRGTFLMMSEMCSLVKCLTANLSMIKTTASFRFYLNYDANKNCRFDGLKDLDKLVSYLKMNLKYFEEILDLWLYKTPTAEALQQG